MARYNAWQNASLVAAAGSLTDAERRADRGAFFGSIVRTFNHLLWDDALWLARFAGEEDAEARIEPSPDRPRLWEEFKERRLRRDTQIAAWADALTPEDLDRDIAWRPGGGSKRMVKPAPICAIHLFNHQTHHRGQIHSMLTAAGATPEPTDLPVMA